MSDRPESRVANVSARLLALLAGLGAILLLAACGGSGHGPSASEAGQEQRAEQRDDDYARCLREHGINAEAVSGPNGGHGLKVQGGKGGPQSMEAAESACKKYRPEPKKVNLSPQQKVELEEGVRKFASCMREHGIKVHASTTGGGVRIGLQSSGSGNGPNPESPSFQKAQQTCQHLLPGPAGKKGSGSSRVPGPSESVPSGAQP
jgi:hypothetical protein